MKWPFARKVAEYKLIPGEAQVAADWLSGWLSDYEHIMRPSDVTDVRGVLAKLPKPSEVT